MANIECSVGIFSPKSTMGLSSLTDGKEACIFITMELAVKSRQLSIFGLTNNLSHVNSMAFIGCAAGIPIPKERPSMTDGQELTEALGKHKNDITLSRTDNKNATQIKNFFFLDTGETK